MINLKPITSGFKIIQKVAAKHAPTIYICVGVGLMGAAVIKTIIEAPKAKEEITDLDETIHYAEDKLSVKTYVRKKTRIIVSHYWPIALMTTGGAVLIFWGHKISLGRTAAALAAYQMSKDDLRRLESKISEMDGEKHLEKAKDEIAKDKIAQVYREPIYTGKGNIRFVDSVTGQVFYSNFDVIERAVNALNARIHSDSELTASLNTWLDLIGCENSDIGDKLGWRFTKLGDNVEVRYKCVKDPDTMEVTHYIDYNIDPIWDFDSYNSSDEDNRVPWFT